MWFGRHQCNKEYRVIVILTLCMLWECLYGESIPGFSIRARNPVNVQHGLCVHIPCTFTVSRTFQSVVSQGVPAFWFKKDSSDILVASNDNNLVSIDTRERFLFIGNVKRGDCSLSINNAKLEDRGEYYFRLGEGVRFTYTDIQPSVNVFDLTEKPKIYPIRILVAGEETQLVCTAPGRCAGSPPLIRWEGNVNIIINQTTIETHKDNNKTISSMIRFTPYERDHNSTITCNVTYNPNSLKNATTSNSITLNIEYPPTNITISGNDIETEDGRTVAIQHGKTLILQCTVNGKPRANITWRRNNKEIEFKRFGKSLKLVLQNISCSDADIYTCAGINKHGNLSKIVNITVTFAPRTPEIRAEITNDLSGRPEIHIFNETFQNENYTLRVLDGSTLSLFCSSKSNPQALLIWMKSDQKIVTGSLNGVLKLSKISAHHDGLYTCQATNRHGNATSSITVMTYEGQTSIQALIIGSICGTVLFLLLLFAVLLTIYIKKKRQLKMDESAKVDPVAEDIYCNPEDIEKTTSKFPTTDEVVPNSLESTQEEASMYRRNSEELHYVTLDFSKLKTRTLPDEKANEETVEYMEVKHN